ncbi:MAG: hypothetical protein KDI18_16755, partial [Gammaproteobacteria bacterium]|nr:hypothetical protein [Gammaproteobacteria bacterium]
MSYPSQDKSKQTPLVSVDNLLFRPRPLHLIIAVAFILTSLAPIKFDLDHGTFTFTEVLAKGGDDDDDDD